MSQPGGGIDPVTTYGPYTILERIGAGGMGVVYRAIDRRAGTVVAVKLLHEHIAADPGALERFRREAHVASLLRSAYVVRTVEFGEDRGRHYLVTDFVEGCSLAEMLKDGPIEAVAAIAIVTQAALALDEAHSREITHRDIKPDNILITPSGSVRLADFGIASLAYLGRLTQAGAFIGTVAYSAPEQHRGEADIRSDIYSLGVVLFEMLAGRLPFSGPTAAETMRLHEVAAPPLDVLAKQPHLREVVSRCLQKDPAARFQRPSELLSALESARLAVAGAVGEKWMETAVAPLVITAPPDTSKTTVASSPGPLAPAPVVVQRHSGVPRKALAVGAAASVALLAGFATVFALMTGGDGATDEDKDDVSDASSSGTSPAIPSAAPTQEPTVTPTQSPTVSTGASPTTASVAAPTSVPAVLAATATSIPPTPAPPTPIPPTPAPATPTTTSPTPIPQNPGNIPPTLPVRSFQFSAKVGESKVLFTDKALSTGWVDPDGTAGWLCLQYFDKVGPFTWELDGADCEGQGLTFHASVPGTYTFVARAREDPDGKVYSQEASSVTVTVTE